MGLCFGEDGVSSGGIDISCWWNHMEGNRRLFEKVLMEAICCGLNLARLSSAGDDVASVSEVEARQERPISNPASLIPARHHS